MADYGNSGVLISGQDFTEYGENFSYTPPQVYDYSSHPSGGLGSINSEVLDYQELATLNGQEPFGYLGNVTYDFTTANMPQAGSGISALDVLVPSGEPPSGPTLKVRRNGVWVEVR